MISQGLTLTQKQTLRLNTQLLQSLELMTLSVAELREKIDTQLLENPTLKAEERDPSTVSYEDYTKSQLERESRRDSYADNDEASDNHQSWLEGALSSEETLQDHLLWQLGCTKCPPSVRSVAETLISNLDENGFFNRPVEEILSDEEMKSLDAALGILHSFDPVGIAVKDYRESLMVQAASYGLEDDEMEIFRNLVYTGLDRIKAGKEEAEAKALGISEETLEDYLAFLRTLTPYPASSFIGQKEHYIVPDVSIKVEDGRLVVRLNDSSLPVLSLDSGYQEMAKELSKSGRKDEKEAAKYLRNELNSASELIRQIEMRNSTLEKVAKVLAVKQKAFFLFGQGSLKPLTLKEVAQEIGVHEATVSRITSSKYVDTDWGVIPMKSLFSSAVRTSTGEGDLSKEAVKEMVRSIIGNNQGAPLSDQKISDILKAKGISCARRTVAKYRKELDIDSSFERRS